MHNESVLIVNDQQGGSNADPANSSKLAAATNLNKASKTKPTTTDFPTGLFKRASSICPKHLTPSPFLRKGDFVEKAMTVTSYMKNANFIITCKDPSLIQQIKLSLYQDSITPCESL